MVTRKRKARFGTSEDAVVSGLTDALAHINTALTLSRVLDAHLSFKAARLRLQEASAALDELIRLNEQLSSAITVEQSKST